MRVEKDFDKSVLTPTLCRDKDDLSKLMLGLSLIIDTEMCEPVSVALKHMCHDYMALCLSGKFEPYEYNIENEELEGMRKEFQALMTEITDMLMESGRVPMKEEDGRFKIDFEQLEVQARKKDGKD